MSAYTPPFEIRATHPYGYRAGQWAVCWTILHREDRDCYFVRFPDGETDLWVVNDPSEPYEFRPLSFRESEGYAHMEGIT